MATRKKLWVFALVAAMVVAMASLAGCGGNDNSKGDSSADVGAYENLDPVTLKFGANVPNGGISDQWMQAIVAKADELTGGKLTIELYPYGELGSNADIMRQVQAGDVDIQYTEPATLTSFIPAMAVFDMPMAFQPYSADQIETVLNGDNEFTQKFEAECEKAGIRTMYWLQNKTFRQVTSNKELRTLDDFKGFQIRTMENAYHMGFWSAVGAEPTPLAFAELYFALQNGTVDGEENALFTAASNHFQEVQKYLCYTNHILYTGHVSMNVNAWNALDPAYQEALSQAIQETAIVIREGLLEDDKANEAAMVDAGMEVITYDDSFFEEFLAKEGVQKVYSDISKDTNGLSDLLLAALAAA